MTTAEIVAALDLPPGSRVDQRIPKTLLVESKTGNLAKGLRKARV